MPGLSTGLLWGEGSFRLRYATGDIFAESREHIAQTRFDSLMNNNKGSELWDQQMQKT